VLTNKLCDVFEAKADYANAMQDRYVVALKAFVIFLDRSGVAQPAPARLALDARDGVSSACPVGPASAVQQGPAVPHVHLPS
jgi:hypothetical protein